eukprot:6201651-Pleurochrysis_carterae.AAC.1
MYAKRTLCHATCFYSVKTCIAIRVRLTSRAVHEHMQSRGVHASHIETRAWCSSVILAHEPRYTICTRLGPHLLSTAQMSPLADEARAASRP